MVHSSGKSESTVRVIRGIAEHPLRCSQSVRPVRTDLQVHTTFPPFSAQAIRPFQSIPERRIESGQLATLRTQIRKAVSVCAGITPAEE